MNSEDCQGDSDRPGELHLAAGGDVADLRPRRVVTTVRYCMICGRAVVHLGAVIGRQWNERHSAELAKPSGKIEPIR